MSWANFPYGFIIAFLGSFGCAALIAYALVKA